MTSGGNEKTLENVNFSDVFKKLSKDQLRFVVAMQECNSKKEAAKMIGLNPNSVYNWGDEVDEAIMALALDITQSAREMRKKALAKAVAVKLAALDSDDERIRQAAATEIIEAELGKAKQAMDLTTGGDKIFVTLKSGDED
jgi:transposase